MKVIVIILIVILIILLVSLIILGNKFYNLALNPAISKDSIFDDEKGSEKDNTVSQEETSGERKEEDIEWLLKESNYENEYIESFDGLKLHGYKIKNKKKNDWVITVHGYTSEGKLMATFAREFYNMGYNLIIPDLRGHGMSEGNYIGMGWKDRFDIIKWINFILEENKDANIILHGVSMGGAAVMMVSGEELPPNVKVIIEDCGYTSVWNEFSYQLKVLYNLPPFPVMNATSLICKVKAGYFFKEASSIKQLKKAKKPILFIHGDADDFVPYYMLDKVYSACKSEKEKLVIRKAGHAKSVNIDPNLYWKTVENFINKYTK